MPDRIMQRASFAVLLTLLAAQAMAQPQTFVDAASVVPGLIVEMRYATAHNFVGRPIDGYEAPLCLLTRPTATALAEVARDLEPKGFAIKAFDCYRPTRAVAHFVRWARDLRDVRMKPEFYPDVDKSALFRDGYIAAYSGHSRGSTIDMTLVRRDTNQEIEMGTPFDFFSPRAAPSDRHVSAEARANRALLAQAMRRRGFVPYKKEWWHFTLRHEPYPQTYFNFPMR